MAMNDENVHPLTASQRHLNKAESKPTQDDRVRFGYKKPKAAEGLVDVDAGANAEPLQDLLNLFDVELGDIESAQSVLRKKPIHNKYEFAARLHELESMMEHHKEALRERLQRETSFREVLCSYQEDVSKRLKAHDDKMAQQEMAEKLEAVSKVAASQSATTGQALQPQSKPTFDWTTYGIDEDLDGEHVEDHVRIHHLTLTAEQLRSHCQTLEVENASMKDLMAAFEMGLDAHAQAIGHVNHKQKIRYTLQLKETINRLLDELRRSRTRIFQLEGAKGQGRRD
jgi:hypothetical protein